MLDNVSFFKPVTKELSLTEKMKMHVNECSHKECKLVFNSFIGYVDFS